jgi:hypothetical protein
MDWCLMKQRNSCFSKMAIGREIDAKQDTSAKTIGRAYP